MSMTIDVAPVRKHIRVEASPDRAFEVFTGSMTSWWPRHHSIGRAPIHDVIVEPGVGGRWYERGEDGSECSWGKVLAWDPPSRLVLAWQISSAWQFDPAIVTEVEIRFSADGDATLVELEHRLDGYGAAAEQMRNLFDGPQAWQDTLQRFAGRFS
jgi:uncharacterized protein YndB with AHSA1/START domain